MNSTVLLAIIAFTALVFGVGSGFAVHEYDLDARAVAVAAQKKTDFDSCNADKQLTERITHGIQKQLDAATAERDSLLLRPHAACLPVTEHPAATPGAGGAGHAGGNEISYNWLVDYGYRARNLQTRVIFCEDFLLSTWKAKGQALPQGN